MFICKHCKKQFEKFTASQKANHSRWCLDNPKRYSYNMSGKQLQTEESIRKRTEKIKIAHKEGKYKNAGIKSVETRRKNNSLNHTHESIEKIREKALSSNHRRLVRSVRPYSKKDGTTVLLDSSWEEELAKRLDFLNILWERPEEPIKYLDKNGKTHNYFPDFFLPEHNIFLDPKNPAALSAQKDKIEILLKNMNNLIIIQTLEECKNFIV